MLHRLQDDLLMSALEFLGIQELARCQQVSRKLRQASNAVSSHLQQNEWIEQRNKYHWKYNKRFQMRQQGSDEELSNIDRNMSHALSMIAIRPFQENSIRKRSKMKRARRAISKFLDAGANASQISSSDFAENFGIIVDNSLQSFVSSDKDFDYLENTFLVMKELICSPCTSWREHMIYRGGPGGMTLPYYVMNFVLYGGPWAVAESKFNTSVSIRLKGLRVLRLMVYHDCQNTSNGSRYVEWLWRRNTMKMSDYMKPVTLYFVKQTTYFLLQFYPRNIVAGQYYSSGMEHPLCNNNTSLCFLMISFFAQRCFPLHDKFWPWNDLLRSSWGNKETEKIIHHIVATNHQFRFCLLQNCLPALCRRKDRKMLELLFRLEPYLMLRNNGTDGNVVCQIITALNRTRGKSERLKEYMVAIQNTHIKKARCMNEMLANDN